VLKKLIELSSHKAKIDLKRGEAKYMDFDWLLNEIVGEIDEVRVEIKEDNRAYLEDELGDILWGWMILVQKLKNDKLIRGHEEILERCLKKYEERINPLNGDFQDHEIWREVKIKQKEALAIENKMLKG